MTNKIIWPSWPKYSAKHEEVVLKVIRSNQLYAAGEVKAFESEFCTFTGSKFASGVGNATQGLHLALCALGIGVGDEVVVTPYSWISSASCVLMQNAVPIFADIEKDSFGICPEALKKVITSRTKAVILVHMFGLSAKIEQVLEICSANNIALIEDASHAHGGCYKGKSLGTFGKIGVFSLHQRKAIPAGDGGIVCTNDEEIYNKIWGLRSFGNEQLSYNYRMTEFAASLARVGLTTLNSDNSKRKKNHHILAENVNSNFIKVIEPLPGVEAVYYSNLIDINLSKEKQLKLCDSANSLGIPLKRTWQPLHKHPHFKTTNMPNQVSPWSLISDQYIEPEQIFLPNSNTFQEHRLYELDCHPLVPHETVNNAGKIIKQLSEQINEN